MASAQYSLARALPAAAHRVSVGCFDPLGQIVSVEAVARGQRGTVYFGVQYVYVRVRRPAVAWRLDYGKIALNQRLCGSLKRRPQRCCNAGKGFLL